MFDDRRRTHTDSLYANLTTALAILLAFGIGYAVGNGITPNDIGVLFDPVQRAARLRGNAQTPDEFDVFWEVWNLVDDRYFFDLPDDGARTEGAIQGMLMSLDDPYTRFTPSEAAEFMRESETGNFEGIGAYVELAEEGGVLIVQPFEGGPAQEAGLRSGDVIIAVDGLDIVRLDLDASLALVRGPANSEVTLTVRRTGEREPFDVTVTRQRIEVPTVESDLLDGDVGYVALFEFNQQASRRLNEAVEALLERGANSLVLDLRNNPGGFLDQAVDVADLFLPEGDVLIQRDVDGNTRSHQSDDGDAAEEIPLVVLVNGGSASASEIVAGAIQDLDRGMLIGEPTFGKGSVQLQYDLSDGSILRVTYAAWFTPDDNAINGEGVQPDLEVVAAEDDESDAQLEAALRYLSERRERAANE
jgi:carboxyl-terminal processing protease